MGCRQCQVLTQNGHERAASQYPFSGVKRTCLRHLGVSAFDPTATLAVVPSRMWRGSNTAQNKFDSLIRKWGWRPQIIASRSLIRHDAAHKRAQRFKAPNYRGVASCLIGA